MKIFDFLRGKTLYAIIAIALAALLRYFGFDMPIDAIPDIGSVMELIQWLLAAMGIYGVGQTQVDREDFEYGKAISDKRKF